MNHSSVHVLTVYINDTLASRELQRRLEAVRFPGYSGDEEEEERLSEIEVFSESESEGNQNSDHVDGE